MVDFVKLSKDMQRRVSQAQEALENAPISPQGNTIKPLKGYTNLWRYRIDDFRIIYSASPEAQVVQLLAIGPRRDIYKRFHHEDDTSIVTEERYFGPDLASQLLPQQIGEPEWVRHPEWFSQRQTDSKRLPERLTPSLLRQWVISAEYWEVLGACETEDSLYRADIPNEVLEKVLDGLWPPTVEQLATKPDYVLFNPADLEEYAAGTLRSFLLKLDNYQRPLVDWALNGPTLIKGGPGSGKSTVALYRIHSLISQSLHANRALPEILFTTYTNALTTFSESLLEQLLSGVLPSEFRGLPSNVRVSTVDKMCRWIVKESGLDGRIASHQQQLDALRSARAIVGQRSAVASHQIKSSALADGLRDDYIIEEFEWVIEGQNCESLQDYLTANRVGRGVPFRRQVRLVIWDLYIAYREWLSHQELHTWSSQRQVALKALQNGKFGRRWDYVIIDEAQDLPPVALALCMELCRDSSGLFLTADANQSLYNRGFRWNQVHEQLQVSGRTRILRRNYRSTREIAVAARDLLVGMVDGDNDAVSQEYVHSGPPPVVYASDGVLEQARILAGQIAMATKEMRLPLSAAVILVPTRSLGRNMAELLESMAMPAKFVQSDELDLKERCVKVMTLHSAKGLEFPVVGIAHVEADRLPYELDTENDDERTAQFDAQRKLFFVGCTRAMRWLFVTYERALPSQFLNLLSEEHWLKY